MRTAIALSSVLLLVFAFGASAEAGGAALKSVDRIAAPGGTVDITVELVNDRAKTSKFKLSARVCGEGGVKGKKIKHSVRLKAGETRQVEMKLPVPGRASGQLVVKGKIRWHKGREEIAERVDMVPGNGGLDDRRPDPSDRLPPGEWPDRETELTGTVSIVEPDLSPHFDSAERGMAPFVMGNLKLDTRDGDTWWLIGNEANVLQKLMREADLERTAATVTGFAAEDIPILAGHREGGKALRDAPRKKLFWMTSFDAEGVTDPRKKIVFHRPMLDGPLSKISETRELVIGTESEWERLLADAGIRLPEKIDLRHYMGEEGVMGHFQLPWEVDFEREMVLAIFAGERRSTGYRVRVLRVTKEDDGGLLVTYILTEPSKHEVVVQVPTSPFAIVAIPRTDARIRFALTDEPVNDLPIPDGPWDHMWGSGSRR